ncbi:MAG: 50S ribosome-binding GTPase [Verrucomicrobiota bacterium]
MLGQQYFDLRSNLRDTVGALAQLAEETDLSASSVTKVRNVLATLKDSFRLVVLGEAGTGKSTLVNAVFGEDLCPVDDAHPLSKRIEQYQYGKEKHDFEVSDSLLECYRPLEVLNDFTLVDVPGDGSIKRHQQQVIEEILPAADFILVVFPVTDPWSPTTWKMLERIYEKWQDKIVLILQQCDRRSDEEIDAILEHLRRTSINRCQTQFPTFALAGKKALLAKTSGLDKDRLLKESRIAELETYLSQVINRSGQRLEKMDEACVLAKSVLKEVRDKLHTPAEIIRADDELFATLEVRAEKQQSRTEGKFEPVFSAFDNAFMSARLKTDHLLDSRMGIISSLQSAGDLPAKIEEIITDTTLEHVKRTCEDAALVAEDDVRKLWDELSHDMQKKFKLKLSVGKTGEPDWSASRKRLVEQVENATSGELKNPYLCDGLKKFFRRRRRRMWGFLLVSLFALIGGGWLLWKGWTPFHLIAFGASAIALFASVFAGFKGTAKIRAFFSEELDAQRTRLHDALRLAFNQGVDQCYTDFVRLFDPLREVCTQQRKKYAPLLEAVDELEGSFADLEDELWKRDRKMPATK